MQSDSWTKLINIITFSISFEFEIESGEDSCEDIRRIDHILNKTVSYNQLSETQVVTTFHNFSVRIDILLLGCCNRFSCTLIKLAKITIPSIHSPPTVWMSTPINLRQIFPCQYIHVYTKSIFVRLKSFSLRTGKRTLQKKSGFFCFISIFLPLLSFSSNLLYISDIFSH